MGCYGNQPLDWDTKHPYHGPTVEDRDKRIALIAKKEAKEASNNNNTSNNNENKHEDGKENNPCRSPDQWRRHYQMFYVE